TIMVLELHIPSGNSIEALWPLAPVVFSYVMSFIYLGIYWNNHHHMLYVCDKVTGSILWANLHLLFWLSLIPFTTAWMGESKFSAEPVALYGAVLLMTSFAYWMLQHRIIVSQGEQSRLKYAVGSDWKGRLSMLFYLLGTLLSFASQWLALAIYIAIAILWLIPDQRIERSLNHEAH
ncbi:TMEM175 family protein, partial [Rheinheimera sp.]|uniref:TMEM175 family protein n=1 Tax=Rheinheimera sp. TaxID=1869214 RepID=UPI00261FD730